MAVPTHRSVYNIHPSIVGGHSSSSGAPASPHTPIRTISSTFGSPSTLRAEEDCIVAELGTRYLRIGLAGDALPKGLVEFGPELQKRAGDYRSWELDYDLRWRDRVNIKKWGERNELWKLDLRNVDLALVGDKIEKAIREALTKFLLIDSRPRRMALILPSALPIPLLSTVLNTLFHKFQPPTISLISAPVAATVSAGLRSGLVIDIGWAETVVTGVYEYREVLSRRTIRASKLLGQEMLKILGDAIKSAESHTQAASQRNEEALEDLVSFEECEDIISRTAWCKSSMSKTRSETPGALAPVQEEEEEESNTAFVAQSDEEAIVPIPLCSTQPPMSVKLPFSTLARPCETAFFADGVDLHDLDDEELPLHQLVYRTLLYLPVDVRSVCMSRILFTGGSSNIPGLRGRIMDDVESLIQRFGWDLVQGKVVERLKSSGRVHSSRTRQANDGPTRIPEVLQSDSSPEGRVNNTAPGTALEEQETDPIEEHLKREASKGTLPPVQGVLRTIDSLGAWSGASILSQLKIPVVSLIEREQWLQHGVSGASKHGEVNITKQRQSMGPGGLRAAAAAGEQTSWTLGIWG